MKYKSLFSPITLATQEVKNRVFMAPMGTGFEEYYYGGRVSTEMIDYYEARAKGGTGLIISPFAAVDERYYALTMGIYSRKLLMGISRLAEALHVYDCKFLVQLSHFGGKSPKYFTYGNDPVAPSSIESRMYPEKPLELSQEEIEEIIGLFIQSGMLARDAGCDGVELHGAHGYLINQFYSPHTNKRNDLYGGTLEKRSNFLLKIAEGIRHRCGKDFIIGFKFSAHEHLEGGIDDQEAKNICKYLDGLDLLDYIHVSGNSITIPGFTDCSFPEVPPIYNGQPLVPLAEMIKKVVKMPIIATSGIGDPEMADDIICSKKADIVALGRALIADPDWANKAKNGGNIKPCIKCNTCYKRVLNQQSLKCSVNPYAGEEKRYLPFLTQKANFKKKVIIIGSGPAGLEAAIVAKKRGHDVTILEKKDKIGGNLRIAAVQDFKKEVKNLLDYYKREIVNTKIDLRLNKKFDYDEVLREKPDVIILAIGAEPIIPDFLKKEKTKIILAENVLENYININLGNEIAVVGAGLIGCELSLFLTMKKKKVYLFDCLSFDDILKDKAPVNRCMLLTKLKKAGVEFLFNKNITDIKDREIFFSDLNTKETGSIKVDNSIVSVGYKPLEKEVLEIKDRFLKKNPEIELKIIGDCLKAGKIYDAINKGAQCAWLI